MYVTETSIGGHNMTPELARDEMVQRRQAGEGVNAVEQLRTVAGLCNSGEFDAATENLPLHERKINGDATDQAVLRLSESLGPVTELRKMWKKTFELAFNSKNKYMIRTLALAEPEGLKFALPSAEAATFRPDDTLVVPILL
jgi:sodium/potassium-transporting ATPase subunit alpha